MTELLIQSCSKRKREHADTLPALERYDGYFFRILKKAKREERWPQDLELVILSAEHGIVRADEAITYYDRRMTKSRAAELKDDVVSDIKSQLEDNEIQRIWVNVGSTYRAALEGLDRSVEPAVRWIEGDGIGSKGHQLKSMLENWNQEPTRA